MSKHTLFAAFTALMIAAASTNADVILTGIIDGSDSSPKGIELYVSASMDLTGYSIEIESNGGSSWSEGYAFSGTFGSGFYYITSTPDDMIDTFASATASNTIDDGSFNQNGNDAIRILDADDNVVDQFGDPSEISGSGDYSAPWAYDDSYAYRNNGTGPDDGWVISHWTLPGRDYIDDNNGDDTLFPAGTYVPEPATLALLGVGGLLIARRRRG